MLVRHLQYVAPHKSVMRAIYRHICPLINFTSAACWRMPAHRPKKKRQADNFSATCLVASRHRDTATSRTSGAEPTQRERDRDRERDSRGAPSPNKLHICTLVGNSIGVIGIGRPMACKLCCVRNVKHIVLISVHICVLLYGAHNQTSSCATVVCMYICNMYDGVGIDELYARMCKR